MVKIMSDKRTTHLANKLSVEQIKKSRVGQCQSCQQSRCIPSSPFVPPRGVTSGTWNEDLQPRFHTGNPGSLFVSLTGFITWVNIENIGAKFRSGNLDENGNINR